MIYSPIHPSVGQLLRLQLRGRMRRGMHRWLQPRRLVFTVLAALLALVWLANAAVSVWLRTPAGPQELAGFVSLTLSVYALWHLMRVACFRPEKPLEWSPAEQELLVPCPLRSEDLIGYHLAKTMSAAILKAACVALLLLPDLRLPLWGLAGVLLALLAVDLIRIALEIVAWGMSDKTYLWCRTVVIAGAIAGGGWAAMTAIGEGLPTIGEGDSPFGWLPIVIERLRESGFGKACRWIFHPFVALIAAESSSDRLVVWCAAAASLCGVLTWGVVRAYGSMLRAVARREQFAYQQTSAGVSPGSAGEALLSTGRTMFRLPRVSWWWGVGPLAWRQSLGAFRQSGNLLAAMAAPATLAFLPAFAPVTAAGAFLSIVGALAFYSFLLMPTALKFDFRRDYDRLAMLQSLPISRLAATIGQLTAPTLVATFFQSAVLVAVVCIRPVSPLLVAGALVLLSSLNVLIFALDNLVFLWYPHRLDQEGIEIFVRTTLTFTAKGLLFALALAGILAWSLPAAELASLISGATGFPVSGYAVFFAGILTMLLGFTCAVIYLLSRAYGSFDPSVDWSA